jgi:radical SAM protein with 4Fe4S-binding SPASM domain
MQKLLDRQISFAAIAVLSRDTLPKIRQTYRFFDGLGIRHRVLAYYRSVGSEQAERHGLEFDELVAAYNALFDEWLASERATPVDPIKELVRCAVQYVTGFKNDRYDRSKSERVFIVDVNGDVFNPIESYESEFRYGNLFEMPFREIAESEARTRSVALTDRRTERFCRSCEYFGSCPGTFVANATDIERKMLETNGCPVHASLSHILDVFERTGLHDFIVENQQPNGSDLAEENPALNVA